MNEDTRLQQLKEKWQSLKLSDSARTKMETSLLSYVAFHPVRVDDVSRSIKRVPLSTSLFRFKMTTMPIAILLAIFVSAGTSFAAQGALPGDFLYPVKTEVNENIRAAFAMSANAEANLQADLLEERLEEAKELHASGKLTGDTAVAVSSNLSSQVKVATQAAARSEASVGAKTNTRVEAGLKSFLALVGLDASLSSEINATLNASSLATGTYAISAYQEDMTARVNSLKEVMVKYQADVEASVSAQLNAKLDIAATLVADAKAQVEVDARASLDKAAILAGEVESKLTTLGQAQVDGSTGIITNIDFSIDPMKSDSGGESSTSVGNNPDKTQTNTDTTVDSGIDTNIDTDTVEVNVENTIRIKPDLNL